MPEETTTITTGGTLSAEMQNIESGLNVAATVGAALGGPMGAAADAGLQAVEGVVNTVVEEAPHQTALTDVQNAVKAAVPVIAAAGASGTVSSAAASQATVGLSLIDQMIAFLKGIF